MRGEDQRSEVLFSYVRLESRIPTDHPLRAIRTLIDEALNGLSRDFNKLYARDGRPSIQCEGSATTTQCVATLNARFVANCFLSFLKVAGLDHTRAHDVASVILANERRALNKTSGEEVMEVRDGRRCNLVTGRYFSRIQLKRTTPTAFRIVSRYC